MTRRRHRLVGMCGGFAAAVALLSCDSGGSEPAPALPDGENVPVTSPGDPEIVFHGGVVVTMDESRPQAEAILVRGERIAAVGSSTEVLAQAAPGATRIDLGGRTVVPGFIDAHSHRLGDFAQVGYATVDEVIPDTLAQGWTGLHELYVDQTRLEALRALDAAGALRLRVDAYLPVNSFDLQPFEPWYEAYPPGQQLGPRLRVAGLKFFVDFDSGQVIGWTQDELSAAYAAAHERGWQTAAKSIGTRTLDLILNAVEATQAGQSGPARRHRVEHVLAVTADQDTRLRELGMVAMFQANIPGQVVGEADVTALIAREPEGSFAPWRRMFDAGVHMAGGTGWPSYYADEPEGPPFASPMRLLYQAVTRTGNHGAPPESWMLDQAITVEEALRAYTIAAAHASFTDEDRGSLTAGKLADLVVLSANPLGVPTGQLLRIDVLATMIGGRVEHCLDESYALCPGLPSAPPVSESATPPPADALVVGAGDPIRLAIIAPMSGQHAALGEAIERAVALAVDDAGPIAGFPVEVSIHDEACTSAGGAAAAEAVVDDGGVVAAIGPACSVAAATALPLLEEAGIPIVSPGATDPDLPPLGPRVFNRVILDDDQLAAGEIDTAGVAGLSAVQDLLARYERQVGSRPPASYEAYVAYAYDATAVLLAAVERASSTTAPGLAIDVTALPGLVRSSAGHAGVTGPISFDAAGNRRPAP